MLKVSLAGEGLLEKFFAGQCGLKIPNVSLVTHSAFCEFWASKDAA
jgi:hypothetical protein